MTRAEILAEAKKCVCGEREQEYGTPENNFSLVAELWQAYTGNKYSAKDVAMMLALLKVARIKTGVKGDSFVDLAGYAACAGEIATQAEDTVHCENCKYWASNGRKTTDPFGKEISQGNCLYAGKHKKELTGATNGCVFGEKQ